MNYSQLEWLVLSCYPDNMDLSHLSLSRHTCGSFCHVIVNLYLKAITDMRFADYRLFLFANGSEKCESMITNFVVVFLLDAWGGLY